jgi:hypothetical protein
VLLDALFVHRGASFCANEKCAFDFSMKSTLISAPQVKSGASLIALSPPLARQLCALFLEHIFTLFPMVCGSLLVVGVLVLVESVCLLEGTAMPSFPPRGPQALADCDCVMRF